MKHDVYWSAQAPYCLGHLLRKMIIREIIRLCILEIVLLEKWKNEESSVHLHTELQLVSSYSATKEIIHDSAFMVDLLFLVWFGFGFYSNNLHGYFQYSNSDI